MPGRVKVAAVLTMLLGALVAGGPSRAALPDGFTHSDLTWTELTTPHFRLIYHQGLEPMARTVATIAEGNYDRVVASLGARPSGRTPIILAEYSQQTREFSTQLKHTIFLTGNEINDARIDQDSWFNLVVHEFGHICTYHAVRGGPVIPEAWEWVTAPLVPGWLYEGIAESEANRYSQLGYSVLRAAVLEDTLPPLAGIDVAADRTITDLWLKYAMGQSMVAYMVEMGGPDTVRRLLHEFRDYPSINRAILETLGITYNQFYRQWLEYVRDRYRPALGQHRPVEEYSRGVDAGVAMVRSAKVSPDGRRIAFTAIKDPYEPILQLFVADADGSHRTLLSSDTDLYKSVAVSWSPDSSRLAYGRYRAESDGTVRFGIHVRDLATGEDRCVSGEANATDPAWSPDGQWLAVVRFGDLGATSRIALMRPDGTEERLLTAGADMPAHAYRPAWSPDSRSLCFEVARDGNVSLATLEIEAGPESLRMLTDDERCYDRSPSWSPDGRRIAFTSYRGGLPQVWAFDLEASTLTRLSQEGIRTLHEPSWTPDGRELAVAAWGSKRSELRFLDATRSFEEVAYERPGGAGYRPRYRTEPTVAQKYPNVDPSGWTTKPYDSWDSVRTFLVRPNLVSDAYGLQPAIRAFAQDPLEQHTIAAEVSYSLRSRQPGYILEVRDATHRWAYSAAARRQLRGPVELLPGASLIDVSETASVAGDYLRYRGSTTLGRENWHLGFGWQQYRVHSLTGSPPPPTQQLAFLEARYTRSRLWPGRGSLGLTVAGRASVPALSAENRLYDLQVGLDVRHASAGGRRALTLGLDARAAALSDRFGIDRTGLYAMPRIQYEQRLEDYAWDGLWPHFWLDQLNARLTYRYYARQGIDLVNYYPGHILRAELIGSGHLTHAVPYTVSLSAEYQSGAPAGSRLRYWVSYSTDAEGVFGF